MTKPASQINDEELALEYAFSYLPSYISLQHPNYEFNHYNELILNYLMAIEAGEINRLMIFAPPRHGKTLMISEYFPPWYLGRNPNRQIISATYSFERATDYGRKVRNQIAEPIFRTIFKDCQISPDSKGANRLSTTAGGNYYAVGTSGATTGRGAHLFIIDDPIKGKEDADSEILRTKLEHWFTTIAYTRLAPENAIILIMCIAEGERILMHDGTWKPIEQIKLGDFVISYKDELPVPKRVLKILNHGKDNILEITSRSCSLKVNERHPFLTIEGGLKRIPETQKDVIQSREWNLKWVRAKNLEPGDSIVTIKNIKSEKHYSPSSFKKNEMMNQKDFWLFGFLFGDGWLVNNNKRGIVGFCIARSDKPELNTKVLKIVKDRLKTNMTLTKGGYYRADASKQGRWLSEMGLCSGAYKKRIPEWVFKLHSRDKRQFLKGFFAADGWERTPKAYHVCICNKNLLDDLRLLARTCGIKTTKIYEHEGESKPPNSPSKIKFKQYSARFYDKSKKIELRARYKRQWKFGHYFRIEDIETIKSVKKKNVYDITVEDSESFIAEGFVVHNTRWRFDDFAGYLLEEQAHQNWTVLTLPAIARDNDPVGRQPGEALWPKWYPVPTLRTIKNTVKTRQWNALYQQTPLPEEGGMIQLDWFQRYSIRSWMAFKAAFRMGIPLEETKFPFTKIVCSWDTAFKEKEIHDPSCCTVWGVTKTGYYLIWVFNKQVEFPALKKETIDIFRKNKELYRFPSAKVTLLIEDRASGQSLIQELKHETDIPVIPIKTGNASKVMRLDEVSGAIEGGKVFLPEKAPWLVEYETQMCRFPYDKHDDMVDSTSQFLKWVERPKRVWGRNKRFWK